ncbi:MAG: iron-sulfur cluster assembly scaffold protein [Burkholderiales bacterium]|nr:iron-sulfur cluster assembly scaffold protein [Burkholderiales bacterium]
MYHEAIKSLANARAGHGSLAAPTHRAFLDNPLCGDCVEMQVRLCAGRIEALAHDVKGCLLCRAAASLIAKHAIGACEHDIEQVGERVAALLRTQAPAPEGWEDLSLFEPVHGHPSRYRCVELPFHALLAALRAQHAPASPVQ